MEFLSFKFFFEWFVVIALFLFAIYTMLIIKNEKKTYIKNAKEKMFHGFKLLLPEWWGEVETHDTHLLMFKRLDTRYEWVSQFRYTEATAPSSLTIQELLKSIIEDKKLLFDQDTTIITNPSDFKKGALLKTGEFEMCRVEGTATMDRQERLYYDAFMIRHLTTGSTLFCESKSSVLNGLVEGPYFEEVVERLEYKN
jgi:hypothetical protein